MTRRLRRFATWSEHQLEVCITDNLNEMLINDGETIEVFEAKLEEFARVMKAAWWACKLNDANEGYTCLREAESLRISSQGITDPDNIFFEESIDVLGIHEGSASPTTVVDLSNDDNQAYGRYLPFDETQALEDEEYGVAVQDTPEVRARKLASMKRPLTQTEADELASKKRAKLKQEADDEANAYLHKHIGCKVPECCNPKCICGKDWSQDTAMMDMMFKMAGSKGHCIRIVAPM